RAPLRTGRCVVASGAGADHVHGQGRCAYLPLAGPPPRLLGSAGPVPKTCWVRLDPPDKTSPGNRSTHARRRRRGFAHRRVDVCAASSRVTTCGKGGYWPSSLATEPLISAGSGNLPSGMILSTSCSRAPASWVVGQGGSKG